MLTTKVSDSLQHKSSETTVLANQVFLRGSTVLNYFALKAIKSRILLLTMQTEPRVLNWTLYSVPLKVAQKRIASWIDADQETPVDPDQMRAFMGSAKAPVHER